MFRGSMVALVTPFRDDQIDVEHLRDLVEWHIQAGTSAIVAAGTTGESGTLSHAEKVLVIKTVIDQARERIPVIAGTAANATKDCVALTQEAMALGAHAALIMTPAYIRPTQEGLYQHYEQIAKNVAMPIILYNVTGRTACDLLPETVARLAAISNIIGIKEANSDVARLQQLLTVGEHRIDIYSGDDLAGADWMLQGAKGIISVTANIAPQQMAQLCEAALQQEKNACLAQQEALMPLHRLMFVESNPIPAKWVLSRLGRISGEMRSPLTRLSESHHRPLEEVLQRLNLL